MPTQVKDLPKGSKGSKEEILVIFIQMETFGQIKERIEASFLDV